MRGLFVATLSFLLASSIPSFCCDCPSPGQASEYLDGASIVFVGKVVFSDDDGSGKFTQKTRVHFEVEEEYKGLQPKVRDVWVDPGSFTSCYAVYRVGERYLVFAYDDARVSPDTLSMTVAPKQPNSKPLPPGIDPKNPPKVYVAPECCGTRLMTQATKEDLEYLRKFKTQIEKAGSKGRKT